MMHCRDRFARFAMGLTCLIAALTFDRCHAADAFVNVVEGVQPRIVKIYGAGGLKGLEAYQSGFLISSEGHVLTVFSYVLDTDYVGATLDDGRKFEAKIVGVDPRLEIAILKIDAKDLPFFDLDQAAALSSGRRVLAFSNLFGVATGDEPSSVLHGSVSVVAPLQARRGVFQTRFTGNVYVLDAMTNNPGAAGGALTDAAGQLAGMLGKELRNSQDNTWLNYAVPISALRQSAADILAGKAPSALTDEDRKRPDNPLSLQLLGIRLVPDVLDKTPPFVDFVLPRSPAEKADLQPDDLILFINNRIASSCRAVRDELNFIDRIDPVLVTVQRGQQLLEVELRVE
ncbi:MAG: S1C family serine protease [Pirellulaceae bacterium]|nr:S1C family serine protease [Pirellulaceae bacterium]